MTDAVQTRYRVAGMDCGSCAAKVDAAIALRDFIKPKYAIPMHYGTSPMLRGTPAELKTALGNNPATAVIVPEPGQKVDF